MTNIPFNATLISHQVEMNFSSAINNPMDQPSQQQQQNRVTHYDQLSVLDPGSILAGLNPLHISPI